MLVGRGTKELVGEIDRLDAELPPVE